MKKINIKKKVSNFRNNEGKFTYVNFRRTKPVEPNTIVLEAVHGDSLGDIFFIWLTVYWLNDHNLIFMWS